MVLVALNIIFYCYQINIELLIYKKLISNQEKERKKERERRKMEKNRDRRGLEFKIWPLKLKIHRQKMIYQKNERKNLQIAFLF